MTQQAKINGQVVNVPDDFFQMSSQQQQKVGARIVARQTSGNPSQMMQDITAYGKYLERQDIKNAVADNSSLTDFALSAGVGVNKFGMGVADLLGFGPSEQTARQLETIDSVLAEQSPAANFTGRMAGGTLAAVPTAAAATYAAPQTLGLLGRAAISGLAGLAEGGAELPFSDESRLGNSVMSGASGIVSEPVMSVVQQTLKRIPFGALVDRVAGLSDTIKDKASTAMREMGYDYSNLKQSTRQILESIGRSEDVDVAIQKAVENEQGFNLTAGEASGDFGQISAEQSAVRQSQEAGDMMREFKNQQNEDITARSGQLAEEMGGAPGLNNEGVGSSLKEALDQAKQDDKDGYVAMYDRAKQLAVENDVDIPLNQSVIAQSYYDIAGDHLGTHQGLLEDIGRKLAQYDILDPARFEGDIPRRGLAGDFGPLSVANVEDFVKFLNTKYSPTDRTGNMILAKLKDAVSTNADDALAGAVDGKSGREFLKQARQARSAFKEYQSMWESKDVLHSLTGVKVGTDTPIKSPSDIVKVVTRSPENARTVIQKLIESGNEQAVADLRTYMLKDIFDQAVNPNVIKGELGSFQGAKLNTLIKNKSDVLQAVLTPEQFANLRGFQDAVKKATIHPEGSVNYSNTATKILDAVFNIFTGMQYTMGAGFKELGDKHVVKNAIKTNGRKTVDHILKLDKNHIKLNTLLRQGLEQYSFEDQAALSESEYMD